MAGYNFEIQYVCGSDNKVADALSHIGVCLDEDDVKELLDRSIIKELLSHAMCAQSCHALRCAMDRVR